MNRWTLVRRVAFPPLSAAILAVSWSVPAHAQTQAVGQQQPPENGEPTVDAQTQCSTRHQAGQRLQLKGDLLEAAQAYRGCLDPECSPVLRQDCGERLQSVEADTPTVILAARAQGRELARVAVYQGERLLSDGLSGVAIPLNPGPHELKFIARGYPPHTHKLVALSREKNRVVVVTLASEDAPDSEASSRAQRPTPLTEQQPGVPKAALQDSDRGWDEWDYGLFGAGAGFAIAGVVFASLALTDQQDAERECAPLCSEARRQGIRTKAYAADALLALSLGAFIAGGIRIALSEEQAGPTAAFLVSPSWVGAEGAF